METFSLHYLSNHQVLICHDHDYALSPEGIELHLRRLHTAKGVNLETALNEIWNPCLSLCARADLVISHTVESSIPGLTIVTDSWCTLAACNGKAATLSASC